MTYEEFVIETKTLEEFYGKDLNPTQREIWFEELKHYTNTRYKDAIRYVCKSSQYKPTLSQVLEAMQYTKSNNEEVEITECKACKGTGYILYKKEINGIMYEYASLCNCKNAQGKDYNGSKISDKEHRSKYYIEKAEKVFCGKQF